MLKKSTFIYKKTATVCESNEWIKGIKTVHLGNKMAVKQFKESIKSAIKKYIYIKDK